MKPRRDAPIAFLFAGLLAPAADAERLPAHGRATATTDDSTALVQAPANLAWLPAPELRWSSSYLPEQAGVPWQGHAFAFAFPVQLIGLGTGLRIDLVDPPRGRLQALEPGGRSVPPAGYQVLTWGLALGGEASAVGLAWQRTYSTRDAWHGLAAWTLAWSARPFDGLGLAVVARDFDGDRNGAGGRLAPSTTLAATLRPLGTRALEVGLEGRWLGASEAWVPRGVLGVDLPVGRLRGDFQVTDPGARPMVWQASLGLDLVFSTPNGASEVGFGTVGGTRLGDARDRYASNLHAELAVQGQRQATGSEGPRIGVRLRLERGAGSRAHFARLRRLWELAEREPAVDAVLLELRTAPASSLAETGELRDALFHLRRNGKRVLCHLEDAGLPELYLCSAANRTLLNPAGGLRLSGLRTQHLYLRSALAKLGIRAEFVRIGDHKSAPEQFDRDGASPTARSDKVELLQQYELEVATALAHGRRLTVPEIRARIARGPFVATEALAAGLVDGLAFDDQLPEALEQLAGRSLVVVDHDDLPSRAPHRFGRGRRVAVVHVDGNLVDGRSQVIPFLDTRLVGSYTIQETLEKVREDPSIGAVVLRVESGGGSAMASDVMWREVSLTRERMPVVVSMGSAAASGGYYIAAPAQRIFANPLTITGSIGIFYGKADVAELLRRIGVSVETYKTAPRADAESIFRPFTEDERRELTRKVGQFYDVFLDRVARGRRLSKAAVDRVGQGKVWTGRQAVERGLVDEVGGLRQAIEAARLAAGLGVDAPLVELPELETTLIGRLLGVEGVKAPEPLLPGPLLDLARALAPFAVLPPDRPLALLEWWEVGP